MHDSACIDSNNILLIADHAPGSEDINVGKRPPPECIVSFYSLMVLLGIYADRAPWISTDFNMEVHSDQVSSDIFMPYINTL